MQVVTSVKELQTLLLDFRKNNKPIGFVPTMGALHNGHISLVANSVQENAVTVVSIFVNPTQFNDKNDLKNYPRTLDQDLAKLVSSGADIVFSPNEEEMYPEPDNRIFDFGSIDKVMEGAHRPGHFNGVAQIVSKLFEAVKPDKAYFGEKDFQQLAIIRQLVLKLGYPVQIVPCPIIREADGLAMSSRNTLLSEAQRKSAPLISQTLFKSREMAQNSSVKDVKNWVISTIDTDPELQTEYFEIVDDVTLMPVNKWDEAQGKVGCIAVKVGKIRLIDNIRYNL